MEVKVVFALAVDDVTDDDQRDFRNSALAAERSEIEIDHCADSAVAPQRLANDDVSEVVIDGQRFTGNSMFTLECVRDAVRMLDPDVLIVSASDAVELYTRGRRYWYSDGR